MVVTEMSHRDGGRGIQGREEGEKLNSFLNIHWIIRKAKSQIKEIKGLRILKISSERCRNPSPKKPS